MAPLTRLPIGRVGIVGVRKPLSIQRPGRVSSLAATFEVFVDLPHDRKGSDLSRNAQILAEIIDQTAHRPFPSLEAACVKIARELLERHTYATEAEVSAEAEYFMDRGIAPDKTSLEDFRLLAQAWAVRKEGSMVLRKAIGAEAVGMTACPCAMETCRAALLKEFPRLADPSLKDLPMITHNQRNRTRVTLLLPEKGEAEADVLIAAIEEAQSSPTFAILKRGDEGDVVINAHRKPRFVEDVLREVLGLVALRFPDLPDGTEVSAQTQSEESIHKYDVRADHRMTFGEIRRGGPA